MGEGPARRGDCEGSVGLSTSGARLRGAPPGAPGARAKASCVRRTGSLEARRASYLRRDRKARSYAFLRKLAKIRFS